MLGHFATAAWRNLLSNRVQSAIAIFGLSIGIAAALLVALVIRSQLSFDHFIPGHQRVYRLITAINLYGEVGTPGRAPRTGTSAERSAMRVQYLSKTHRNVAGTLKLEVPEIESVTRLTPTDTLSGGPVLFKQGDISAYELIYWADPNAFSVLPLPTLYGDLANALARPDGLVLPLSSARKYFGRDNVVGEIIRVGGEPMTVRAVIADLPKNATTLQTGIFASVMSRASGYADYVFHPENGITPRDISAETYIRLKPGASPAAVQQGMPQILARMDKYVTGTIPLIPLDRLNLFEGLNPGSTAKLAVMVGTGFLILLVAAINFVNLLTARGSRRAPEIGLRKVCGASRTRLILQFLGESTLVVLLSLLLALSFSELLLPWLNAYLNSAATSDVWRDPSFALLLLLGGVLLALLAGAYPAFVLSAFRPVVALKGAMIQSRAGNFIRSALVTLQFAVLIGTVIASWVIYSQHVFAAEQEQGVNMDRVALVTMPSGVACPNVFKSELRKLPGVAAAFCTGNEFLNGPLVMLNPKTGLRLEVSHIDAGVLVLYGIKPIAGLLPPAGGDSVLPKGAYIANQSAVRRLGYASPAAAIGKPVFSSDDGGHIIAVVPDFALYGSPEMKMNPGIYMGMAMPGPFGDLLHIKLTGGDLSATLAAIDKLWASTGGTGPIDRVLLTEYYRQKYIAILRQAQIFAVGAVLAAFLASLGLLGLCMSVAERRVKEIGIRKAMGAASADIVQLLLRQFALPVLWASLIAWPLAYAALEYWLSQFTYRIALGPEPFLAATAIAAAVALLTVASQSLISARAVPSAALRYE